jgi:hypothetical protein
VRWWDGTKWTEHVSVPAQPVEREATTVAPAAAVAEPEAIATAPVAEAPAAGYGRHAVGRPPVSQSVSDIPQQHDQERVPVRADSLSYA